MDVTAQRYMRGMENFRRYALYYAPPPGVFHDRTAAWLGWDAASGQEVSPPETAIDSEPLTREPRKYGFHGTIRAPFRLAGGLILADLRAAADQLAAELPPVRMEGLRLTSLHGFMALIPMGDPAPLQALGAAVVRGTNHLRAPLTEEEIARRRPERLTDRQRQLLEEFGYPGVMEEFRFHLTLTGPLPETDRERVAGVLADYLGDCIPSPFLIEDLVLFGEDPEGRFHQLDRFALRG